MQAAQLILMDQVHKLSQAIQEKKENKAKLKKAIMGKLKKSSQKQPKMQPSPASRAMMKPESLQSPHSPQQSPFPVIISSPGALHTSAPSPGDLPRTSGMGSSLKLSASDAQELLSTLPQMKLSAFANSVAQSAVTAGDAAEEGDEADMAPVEGPDSEQDVTLRSFNSARSTVSSPGTGCVVLYKGLTSQNAWQVLVIILESGNYPFVSGFIKVHSSYISVRRQ
jgi:hypothetical protein